MVDNGDVMKTLPEVPSLFFHETQTSNPVFNRNIGPALAVQLKHYDSGYHYLSRRELDGEEKMAYCSTEM